MKKHKIYIGVYDTTLTVLIGGSEQDFIGAMKKLGQKELIADGMLGCFLPIIDEKTKRAKHWVIWMEKKEQGTIVHEAFHFVATLMAYRSAHLIEDAEQMYVGRSQEPWAYLLEYVYKEMMKLK